MPDYSDILHHPRPVSTKHPPMSRDERAAQFAPYAALVGHKDLIVDNETAAAHQTDVDTEISVIPDPDYFPDTEYFSHKP